jgi:prophage antirepressor-like protein
MSNLIPFQYESNQIRVITGEDEEPLFVAKDVAEPLGYAWSGIRTIQHIPDEWRRVESVSTPQGMQDLHVLTEQGLYFFLGRSDKPKALPFQKWIAGDVIPSIRKTGSYSLKPKSALELAKEQVALLEHLERIEHQRDEAIRTKAWIGTRREATAMATASKEARRAEKLEQELDRSKEYVTVKRMSMLYHGQKFDWRHLKATSIEMGIEPIDVFDANYGTVKAYHVDVWREAYAIGLPETAA